jgi:ABC-2 type transport system permease protein
MSPDRTLAVIRRVLRQLRHDRRTLGMVFALPPLLLWLMEAILTNSPGTFDRVGPLMLGFFPFLIFFMITSIAVLRERTQGTLDRMMVSPIGRGDLLVGYAVAFTLVALVQAVIVMVVGIWLLNMPSVGRLELTFLVVAGQALLGIALGLFVSAFARTEFQAVQFMPAIVTPQLFLAGLLVPVERLPGSLEFVARILPLTYAFEALDYIMRRGHGLDHSGVLIDLSVIFGAVALALAAAALTLRRTEA